MKFLILLTLCIVSFSAHALRLAVVNKNEATVYSDLAMKSPIGFIRGGKLLKVGENRGFLINVCPTWVVSEGSREQS